MFGRKRRKMDNSAALVTEPAPASVTYNNPGPPWVGVILTLSAVVPFGCVVLWWTGVYVLDTAGYVQPDKALARAIIATIGAMAVLAFVAVLSIVGGRAFLSDLLAHWERMGELDIKREELVTERERYRQLTAQAPMPTGRASSEDVRFARLVKAVMVQAYDHVARSGPYKYGDTMPWSREQAKAIVLVNEHEPVGWEMGSRVSGFLKQYDVIEKTGTAWNVNLKRFPDMGSVDSLLYRLYDKPIMVNSLPPRDNQGFEFIEK